jgi:hypothetical protein
VPGSRQRQARSSSVKGIRNRQEGRHALARKICHGKKGELYHRYERGLEDPLTVDLGAAIGQLRTQSCPVREEDTARPPPFASRAGLGLAKLRRAAT